MSKLKQLVNETSLDVSTVRSYSDEIQKQMIAEELDYHILYNYVVKD